MEAFPREAQTKPLAASIKGEIVKYVVGMVFAAATAHVVTVYGIKDDVTVLKVQMQQMQQMQKDQAAAFHEMATELHAFMLAQAKGARTP